MKKSTIFFGVLAILLVLRLCLPYAILRYAEYRLNKIPEYHVTIKDVDVSILQGGYLIKDISLTKTSSKIPVPFFSAKTILFTTEWRMLLRGMFVAQVQVEQPELNFVTDPKGKNEQLTINQEWQRAVKALFPLNFNHIVVHNGILHFRSFNSSPPFDLYLKNVEASLNHLQEGLKHESQVLPSSLIMNAATMDGAKANLEMYFDPSVKKPTFKLNASLEKMDIRETNNFLQRYTKIKVKQGWFSLYVEAAAAKGKVAGYVKPIFYKLSIVEAKSNNPLAALYKGAVKAATKLLENPSTKTVATKIKITGNIDDPDISIFSLIGNIFRHAFLQALLPGIDHSIKMQDAITL